MEDDSYRFRIRKALAYDESGISKGKDIKESTMKKQLAVFPNTGSLNNTRPHLIILNLSQGLVSIYLYIRQKNTKQCGLK